MADKKTKLFRLHLLSLYAMVFTGLLGVCLAEGHAYYLVIFIVSAALAWIWVDRREQGHLPAKAAWVLTLMCLSFMLFDIVFFSENLGLGVLHFLILILVIKVFQRKTPAVVFQVYFICFLMVICSAVLTTEKLFAGVLAVFLVTGLVSLNLNFFLADARKVVERVACSSRYHMATGNEGDDTGIVVRPRFLASYVALAVSVALVAAFVFFSMPRIHANWVKERFAEKPAPEEFEPEEPPLEVPDIGPVAGPPPPRGVTAFPRKITFDNMGRLFESDIPAMKINLYRGEKIVRHVDFAPLWRVCAFDRFEGDGWTLNQPSRLIGSENDDIYLSSLIPRGDAVTQVVRLEPSVTPYLPHLREPVVLRGIEGGVEIFDGASGMRPADRIPRGRTYVVVSNIPPYEKDNLLLEDSMSEHPDATYTELYDGLDEAKLQRFAATIIGGAESPYGKITAVRDYLQANYRYSLVQRPSGGTGAMEAFLYTDRIGHCEFFASAMVLLLRSADMPARVVGGFRGGEFNKPAGYYLVSMKDAHAWVDVYFNGVGWVAFDPTPVAVWKPEDEYPPDGTSAADDGPDSTAPDETGVEAGSTTPEGEERDPWREYVIDYGADNQLSFLASVGEAVAAFFGAIYAVLPGKFRESPMVIQLILAAIAVALVVGAVAAVTAFIARDRFVAGGARKGEYGRKEVTIVRFYKELLDTLARVGIRRKPNQTPFELAREALSRRGQAMQPAAEIVEYYCAVRFGGARLERSELKKIKNLLLTLRSVAGADSTQ